MEERNKNINKRIQFSLSIGSSQLQKAIKLLYEYKKLYRSFFLVELGHKKMRISE